MIFQPVIDRTECERRLLAVFPRAAFDTSMSSPIAAAGVSAMIYAGAVLPSDDSVTVDFHWMSPTMCLWMSDDALAHHAEGDREDWYRAAMRGKRRVAQQLADWGETHNHWYENNSREPLRDESFRQLRQRGAVRFRPGLPQNYSGPRWALDESFATLFDPNLVGDALDNAIDAWREAHLGPLELVKINVQTKLDSAVGAVLVALPPDNTVRQLEPGVASEILRGVIEQWALSRLKSPIVVSISEPGNKLYAADGAMLAAAGISINVSTLLPDALIVDIGDTPPTFWIVEAVASDGEIDEARKADLLQWAADQKIATSACRFLSAFTSRGSAPARRRLKDLAAGSFAWFLDEPSHELAWYEIDEG